MLNAQVINYVNNPSFENILSTATVNPFDAVKYWGPIDSINNNASYIYSETLGTVPHALGYQLEPILEIIVQIQFIIVKTL